MTASESPTSDWIGNSRTAAQMILVDHDTGREVEGIVVEAPPIIPRVGERVTYREAYETPEATPEQSYVVVAIEHEWDNWSFDQLVLITVRLRVRKAPPLPNPEWDGLPRAAAPAPP